MTDNYKRRNGHWIEDDYAYYHCSECGYEQEEAETATPYCPNCGAKMKMPEGIEVLVCEKHAKEVFAVISGFGQWISVKDKLPEEEGDYLTYLGYGGGDIAELYFDKDEEKFGDLVPKYYDGAIDTEFEEAGAVSHWMPLPELPEIDDEESEEA